MPTAEDSGSDFTTRRAALVLCRSARDLAATGATADSVFRARTAGPGAQLAAAVRAALPLPDRTRGWSAARGLLAGLSDPGPTPTSWREAGHRDTPLLDLAIMLIAGCFGRAFGWEGQQAGRLVHNIVPTPGSEELQVSASSASRLQWHSEDSFHPQRAELLLLACVRNDDGIGSQVASIRRAGLSQQDLVALAEPKVVIVPDDSYPSGWGGQRRGPGPIATIWQAADGPCLRYDPAYTRLPPADTALTDAYRRLGDALNRCAENVPLSAGDVLLVDNDVAVHARRAFTARYDGTDRWLKRVMIRLPRDRPEEEGGGFGQRLIEHSPPGIS